MGFWDFGYSVCLILLSNAPPDPSWNQRAGIAASCSFGILVQDWLACRIHIGTEGIYVYIFCYNLIKADCMPPSWRSIRFAEREAVSIFFGGKRRPQTILSKPQAESIQFTSRFKETILQFFGSR